jgi:hypothetical protein
MRLKILLLKSTLKEEEGAKGEEGKEMLVRLGVYHLLFELFTLER